jgi:hypothetical protein
MATGFGWTAAVAFFDYVCLGNFLVAFALFRHIIPL